MKMRRFLLVAVIAALLSAGFVAFAQAEPGLQSALTAVSGQGTGHVLVSPTAQDRPNFAVQVEVNVRDMLPNSTFTTAVAAPFAKVRLGAARGSQTESPQCRGSAGRASSHPTWTLDVHRGGGTTRGPKPE